MFRTKINPYSVTDKVTFYNLDKKLNLEVRADASVIVTRLMKANAKLTAMKDDTSNEEQREAAVLFASAVFGTEQAEKLVEFYGDPLAVINACGIYFDRKLKKKITKAQKKSK